MNYDESGALEERWHREFAEIVRKRLAALSRHRERYVTAWMAVTGIDPRDAELVEMPTVDGGFRFFVRRNTEQIREGRCDECHRDYPVWYAPNDLWNAVQPEPRFLCMDCFALSAEAKGRRPTAWVLTEESL